MITPTNEWNLLSNILQQYPVILKIDVLGLVPKSTNCTEIFVLKCSTDNELEVEQELTVFRKVLKVHLLAWFGFY